MAEANHWKLGLGVVTLLIGGYVGLMAVAAARQRSEPLIAITYLDESVEGLREGAAVQMRGVRIGRVIGFALAEDNRHVEVRCELDERKLRALGIRDLDVSFGEGEFAPPSLRAFLAASGFTGIKLIQLDFYDPLSNPLPKLGFEPPWNYVPAIASFEDTVQRSIPSVLAAIPGGLDRAEDTIALIESRIEALDLGALSRDTRDAMAKIEGSLEDADVAQIESTTRGFLRQVHEALEEAEAINREIEQNLAADDADAIGARFDTILSDLDEAIRAYREGDVFTELHGSTAAMTEAAEGLRELLTTMRVWARWLRETGNAYEATLGPLGEDPSKLFFEGEPQLGPGKR